MEKALISLSNPRPLFLNCLPAISTSMSCQSMQLNSSQSNRLSHSALPSSIRLLVDSSHKFSDLRSPLPYPALRENSGVLFSSLSSSSPLSPHFLASNIPSSFKLPSHHFWPDLSPPLTPPYTSTATGL